jgi:hypothetical protein
MALQTNGWEGIGNRARSASVKGAELGQLIVLGFQESHL